MLSGVENRSTGWQVGRPLTKACRVWARVRMEDARPRQWTLCSSCGSVQRGVAIGMRPVWRPRTGGALVWGSWFTRRNAGLVRWRRRMARFGSFGGIERKSFLGLLRPP